MYLVGRTRVLAVIAAVLVIALAATLAVAFTSTSPVSSVHHSAAPARHVTTSSAPTQHPATSSGSSTSSPSLQPVALSALEGTTRRQWLRTALVLPTLPRKSSYAVVFSHPGVLTYGVVREQGQYLPALIASASGQTKVTITPSEAGAIPTTFTVTVRAW